MIKDLARVLSVLLGLSAVGEALFAASLLISAAVMSSAGRQAMENEEAQSSAQWTEFQAQMSSLTVDGLLWLGIGIVSGALTWFLWRWGGQKPPPVDPFT